MGSPFAVLRELLFCSLLTLSLLATSQATIQGESKLEPESVETAAADIEQLIRDAVATAGGNLENQRLHLVLAFSTGHFGIDPMRAQAARLTAWELANDLLVRGDLVSVYAFEDDLWNQPEAERNPLTVPADQGAEREIIRSSLPVAPKSNSIGGHDTELAIARITDKVDLSTGPVIVIFTNRAASITTDPTRPIIGQDDKRYQTVLESWRRLSQINQSGASYEPTYDIVRAEGDLVTRSIDVVVLVPKEFRSPPLAEGSRSERLLSQTESPGTDQPVELRRGNPAILLIFLLLMGLAAAAYFLLRRKRAGSGLILSVNSNRFPLGTAAAGEDICRLVGPTYIEANGPDERAIELPQQGLPPIMLARFVRSGKGVTVKNEEMTLHQVDGEIVTAPYLLKTNEEQELTFEGTSQATPGRPPRPITAKITILLGGDI